MADFGLLGTGGAYMQNILDLRQKRQALIGANIANADTPGYKAKRLEFEDVLKEAMPMPGELPMARTNGQHLPTPYGGDVAGELHEVEIPIPKGDKNSVDLEQEMTRLSANQILYNYGVQAFSGQVEKLRMAIEGGQ
ncbi:MAG: flagellar basal body rod protein FlgB [Magnetococcales bacterium]|nr:flagellar basal body rod protein FlgB [Magnetococcales bacterium]NGZ27460.1 flagellar basal body rod protein FlgB [Magnetococcales bacterium]